MGRNRYRLEWQRLKRVGFTRGLSAEERVNLSLRFLMTDDEADALVDAHGCPIAGEDAYPTIWCRRCCRAGWRPRCATPTTRRRPRRGARGCWRPPG